MNRGNHSGNLNLISTLKWVKFILNIKDLWAMGPIFLIQMLQGFLGQAHPTAGITAMRDLIRCVRLVCPLHKVSHKKVPGNFNELENQRSPSWFHPRGPSVLFGIFSPMRIKRYRFLFQKFWINPKPLSFDKECISSWCWRNLEGLVVYARGDFEGIKMITNPPYGSLIHRFFFSFSY